MEIKEIQGFVLLLVLIGMIIGVGVLTLDKFIQASANTDTVINESLTYSKSATINLNHGNLTSFDGIINLTSGIVNPSNYSVGLSNGSIFINDNSSSCKNGDTCYASYKYKNYETNTKTAVGSANSEIAGIATNWVGLIVTVIIMAIILTLVIKSFTGTRR